MKGWPGLGQLLFCIALGLILTYFGFATGFFLGHHGQ